MPEHWVLITEGGSGESRAAVAAVRALAAAGYRAAVTVSSDLSLAGASRFCARRILVPSVESEPEAYATAVRRELSRQPYVAMLPASDRAILALGLPVRHLLDKVACAEAAARVGLTPPPSRIYDSAAELLDRAGELTYPVVVKPDVKRHAAIRATSGSQLAVALTPRVNDPGRVIVQPYLEDGLHGIVGLMWQGRLLGVMHMRYRRLWPLPCGTVASAETIEPDEQLEQRLQRLLAGYDGLFHADLAGRYLLDVNPRLHATLPLAIAAGINPVARYCDALRGIIAPPARARAGVHFRWLEGDLRSVFRGVRDGEIGLAQAVRALAPRSGTVHSYESWRDPGPLWTRSRYIARRFLSKVA